MKQAKKSLQPTGLRLALSLLLVIIAGLAGTGFFLSYQQLQKYAVAVSHTKADDAASTNSLQSLQNIQAELKKYQQAVTRASSITDTAVLPQFEAIADVQTYATRDGIPIQSIAFASSSPSTGTTAARPVTPVAPTASTGQKTVDVTVSFGDEVNYKNFLQFVTDIQNSTPKMQIQGVDLSKGKDPSAVTAGPLTIHMYTN